MILALVVPKEVFGLVLLPYLFPCRVFGFSGTGVTGIQCVGVVEAYHLVRSRTALNKKGVST